LPNVAFRTPKGQMVLIVVNDKDETVSFAIGYGGQKATATLAGGAVATYVWN
jgi:glucosylceramidase